MILFFFNFIHLMLFVTVNVSIFEMLMLILFIGVEKRDKKGFSNIYVFCTRSNKKGKFSVGKSSYLENKVKFSSSSKSFFEYFP